jgi:manganese transport protein
VYRLLILSQVILSLQLPFAVVPLLRFTGSRRKMGPFVSPGWLRALAWLVVAAIVSLNGWLVYDQFDAWAAAAGPYAAVVAAAGIALAAGLGGLLVWLALRRETAAEAAAAVSPESIVAAAKAAPKRFRRIGVALEARPTDADMLAEAIDLAAAHQAELVLMHVVEGVGGQWYGPQTGDLERRGDEAYLAAVAERLRVQLAGRPVAGVGYAIGYGDVPRAIIHLVREAGVDLLVMGGHGHRRLGDLVHGETIQRVRHGLDIPILAIRERAGEG